ncbi:MAG: hypothetical protein EAZ44_03210 [Cytophagia bacterium]|nr:MAG: hypothetical protein EAZ44_03210 [Cytophagia bacterium]TAG39643.1 MAG: hypothetical protein EAZ31_08950 [Cytophagia bacterium]
MKRCIKTVSLFLCLQSFLLNDVIAQNLEINQLVTTAIYQKNWKEAEKLLNQIIQKSPSDIEALKKRGELRMMLGNYKEAVPDFATIINQDPTQAKIYNRRGECYMKIGEYAYAFGDYQQSSKIFGGSSEPYVGMVKALIARKLMTKAKEILKDGIKLDKRNQDLAALEGYIYLLENEPIKAFEILNPIVKKDDKNADANYYMGLYYKQSNQIKLAVQYFEKATQINQFFLEAYIEKLQINIQEGLYSKVEKEVRFLKTHKDYITTEFRDDIHLTILQYVAGYNQNKIISGAYTGAEALSNRTFRKLDNNLESYLDIFKASLKLVKFRKEKLEIENEPNLIGFAATFYKKIIEKNPTYDAHLSLGTIYYKIGHLKKAKDNLLTSLKYKDQSISNGREAEDILAKMNQNTLDNRGPAIFVSSPAMASARGGIITENEAEKVAVIGTVTDENKVISVSINGNPAKVNNNGDFEGEVFLKQEITEIKIIATDELGNQNSHAFKMKKKADKAINLEYVDLQKVFGKRKAVIMVTDNYDFWQKLNNPILDGRKLKEVLENNYGYEVELIENPTQKEALAKLRQLAKVKYNHNDQLLLFYGGHGDFDYDTKLGYVILKDSKKVEDDPERTTWVSHSVVETLLAGIGCQHVGVIIDACFSGTFDKDLALERGDGKIKDIVKYAKQKLQLSSRNFLTSGGKEYVSDGRPGKHSPFMEKLLGILTNVKGTALLSWGDISNEMKKGTDISPRSGTFTNHKPGGEYLLLHTER